MKKYFLTVLILMNSSFSGYITAQINDQPIRLSPEIGDTIDLNECNYYNLFSEIKNFQYAVFYINNDSTSSISRVTYINGSGMRIDTVINYGRDYVGNLKASIRQTNAGRLENYKSDVILTVTKLNGKEHSGKLLSVQDSCLIIAPYLESEVGTQTFLKTYAKINLQEIQSVLIDFGYWSDVGFAAGTGFFIGLISGLVIGYSQPVAHIDNSLLDPGSSESLEKLENTMLGSLIGMAIGTAAGFGIGLILATPDETIEINSASDLERLKEYVVQ